MLAFYATVLGLTLAATVGVVTALAWSRTATSAIPFVLCFGGLAFLLVLGSVLYINLRDPSRLMLGRVTGSEYAEIQHLRLGDSQSGEREVPVTFSGSAVAMVLHETTELTSSDNRPMVEAAEDDSEATS